MVQVDVFWSYGLASGLALAAKRQLKEEKSPWVNKYFIATMLWTACVFAPSGAYLLWAFPYWETMFVARTHTSIPAWLTAAFSLTNITQAWLGYYVTYRLIQAGKDRLAAFQTIWSHAAMLFILVIGWDGTGLKRFLYAGTGDEWYAGVPYEWTAWFSSPVFYALLGMAVVFIPSYFFMVVRWNREGRERFSAARPALRGGLRSSPAEV